ncbi:MAG: hypothetical protein ABI183_10830 [Polyangiaceae bacterium]
MLDSVADGVIRRASTSPACSMPTNVASPDTAVDVTPDWARSSSLARIHVRGPRGITVTGDVDAVAQQDAYLTPL